jgi:FMN phosphatase YigB (HAD superfamily)
MSQRRATHEPRMSIDNARVRGISFDLDGTLYSLRSAKWRFAWHAWRADLSLLLRVSKQSLDDFRGVDFGSGASLHTAWCSDVATRTGLSATLVSEALQRIDSEVIVAALRPAHPNVRLALSSLRVPVAVVSDRGAVRQKLAALHLDEVAWCTCIGATDSGVLKPHPRCLQQVAHAMDIDVSQLLHIGDRDDTDGAAARAVGAQFIQVHKPSDVVAAVQPWRRA